MRDQPLVKPVRVNIPTVLKDEWMEQAVCVGQKPTIQMCHGCPVVVACTALYYELVEVLEASGLSPDELTGVWGGEMRGRRKDDRFNRYAPKDYPILCSVEGCTYSNRKIKRGLCDTHYKKDQNAKKDSA